jgi:hypothetical protein
MKTLFKVLAFLLFSALAVLTGFWFLIGGPAEHARWRHFNKLVKTADHRAVLDAAIPLIRATTNDVVYTKFLSDCPSITNLPPTISTMDPNSVSISPHSMTIEFHGGFDHYGFGIRNNDSHWLMTWYTEKGHHDILRVTNQSEQSASRKD